MRVPGLDTPAHALCADALGALLHVRLGWLLPCASPPCPCCCCCCRYQPGQQVFLCYGRHTNLELLELYGFILPENPHDTALLPPNLLQQHLQHVAARQQQQRQGVEGRRAHSRHLQKQQPARVCVDVSEVDCLVHANGQPSWELLRALR